MFVEYSHELNLPGAVFEHPLIKDIETLGIDWMLIQNDILSYCKEEVIRLKNLIKGLSS